MCGSQFTAEVPWILTFQLLFAFDNIAVSILRFGPGFKYIFCSRVGFYIVTFQLLFALDNIALSILRFEPGFKCILCSRVGDLDCDVPIPFCL